MNTQSSNSPRFPRSINPRGATLTLLLILVVATILPIASARAAVDPITTVQNTVNQSLTVLRDKQTPLAQRQDQLRSIVAGTFEFTEMGKSALGYHWRQITPEQQKEFTSVFVSFIQDSYLSKISDYRGPDYQVNFLGARSDGPGFAQVNTDIIRAGKDPIHVNYRLQKQGDEWKIYDVTVDAISIIANYRNQFNRVMNNQGYATLINDLKGKQASLAARLATR
ncbi:MAG: ABC transporter substrate-binding protein [Candidatus Binatus sp.]|uniref:MlaC/ttg2D family ABC transporter substrate-binding protein n=1 Tax=Candidatus Binatus sp. TaxID=2811406 RepID=UPI002718B4A1|nr:ABC transporter substrate-binding protein [Candidatus Binatus sp.]MDO8434556.1 ABC transporter substrate-binding protein [Candidatus Binatus sp.]